MAWTPRILWALSRTDSSSGVLMSIPCHPGPIEITPFHKGSWMEIPQGDIGLVSAFRVCPNATWCAWGAICNSEPTPRFCLCYLTCGIIAVHGSGLPCNSWACLVRTLPRTLATWHCERALSPQLSYPVQQGILLQGQWCQVECHSKHDKKYFLTK